MSTKAQVGPPSLGNDKDITSFPPILAMSTPLSLRLDPDLFDPSWDALPNDGVEAGGLSFASTQIRHEWIVRLDFKQDSSSSPSYYFSEGAEQTELRLTDMLTLAHIAPKGEQSHGTGFYINIPDIKAHVILTAAHNLVDKQGKRSRDLQFHDALQGVIIKPRDLDIFISPLYLSNPRTETDFGAIRVPNSKAISRGFGFSLKLAEESLRGKSLHVCGFPADWTQPEPSTSSGNCKRWIRNLLEYQIATAKGLSGAPVFMPFKGHDTVVGIQCVFPYVYALEIHATRCQTDENFLAQTGVTFVVEIAKGAGLPRPSWSRSSAG